MFSKKHPYKTWVVRVGGMVHWGAPVAQNPHGKKEPVGGLAVLSVEPIIQVEHHGWVPMNE